MGNTSPYSTSASAVTTTTTAAHSEAVNTTGGERDTLPWSTPASVHESISFRVSPVTPSTLMLQCEPVHLHLRRIFLDKDYQKMVRHACSHDTNDDGVDADDSSRKKRQEMVIVNQKSVENAFIAAPLLAFDKHLPFVMRPQFYWLTILQAIAIHVEANAEVLRSRFVRHSGKKELRLDVTIEAVTGFSSEQWAQVVASFDTQINENVVQGVYPLLSCRKDFSDTTPEEHVAAMMTVMDACKSYFDYRMMTRCAFPMIIMEGTEDDWRRLRSKAEETIRQLTLPEFHQPWLAALLPVLDRFVDARCSRVPVDIPFWESMVKIDGTQGSGSHDWISGWINVFMPYLNAKKPNPFCVPYNPQDKTQYKNGRRQTGPDTDDFISGLCSAPVDLDNHPLEFRAGFVGVGQTQVDTDGNRPVGAIYPCVGWYVASGKSDRTEKHFGMDVHNISPDTAAILTRVGAVIPLLPFASPRTEVSLQRQLQTLETVSKKPSTMTGSGSIVKPSDASVFVRAAQTSHAIMQPESIVRRPDAVITIDRADIDDDDDDEIGGSGAPAAPTVSSTNGRPMWNCY